MAMRLNSLSLQKKFSIRWRHLYISRSMTSGGMRRGCWAMTTLAPRASRSAIMAFESNALSAIRASKNAVNERREADRVEALPRQKHEAHEIAERISQGHDLGGHAAFGAPDGLARSPPFAPCPWRWTLTMVASTMAYSISGSSETASNSRFQTSAFTQPRKRVYTLLQFPSEDGKSRHGLPVRTIHKTASTKSRLSLPLRPGSPGLPRQSGSIFAHWASLKTNRSIRSLNHSQARMRILNPNRP